MLYACKVIVVYCLIEISTVCFGMFLIVDVLSRRLDGAFPTLYSIFEFCDLPPP